MVVCELDNVIEIEMQEFGSALARDWLEFGIDHVLSSFQVLSSLCSASSAS